MQAAIEYNCRRDAPAGGQTATLSSNMGRRERLGESNMSVPAGVLVKPVGPGQASLVAEILADAFRADPVMEWISHDPAYPKWVWLLLVPLLLPYNEVYVTGDGLGTALWLPPGVSRDMLPNLNALLSAMGRFGLGAIFRLFQFMSLLEKHHPKESHYYLFAIGVRTTAQGHGIGSALLGHVLEKCDRRGVGAYVESSSSRSLSLYQRHGFEIQRKITLPRNGPALWLMYRRPRPAQEPG